jgi:hypothetical protein
MRAPMRHKLTDPVVDLDQLLEAEIERRVRRAADIERLRIANPELNDKIDSALKDEAEREIGAASGLERFRHLEARIRRKTVGSPACSATARKR